MASIIIKNSLKTLEKKMSKLHHHFGMIWDGREIAQSTDTIRATYLWQNSEDDADAIAITSDYWTQHQLEEQVKKIIRI